jgi:hypothetical protein
MLCRQCSGEKKNMKLSATLDEENSKRFQEVKKHFGLKANRSVVELLIGKEYDRIQDSKTHKLAALLNDANQGDLLAHVRKVYPKFPEISLLVELSKTLGKEAMALAFYLVTKSETKIDVSVALGYFLPTLRAFRSPDKRIETLWPKVDKILKTYRSQYRKGFRQGIDKSIAELERTKKSLDEEGVKP